MLNAIKETIQTVFERDPAARSTLETLLTCSGLQAILLHHVNHYLWQHKFYLLARITAHITRFLTGVEIHPGAVIGRRFFIDHGMGIVIGETVEIGNDVSIYHGATLGGTTWKKGKRHPTLENSVVIGAGAKVLGPVVIGAGTRIGCNAVVVKDTPPNVTVVGVPGHIVTKNATDDQRATVTKEIGFAAYATSKDMPDPVQGALDLILKHMQKTDQELAELKRKIK